MPVVVYSPPEVGRNQDRVVENRSMLLRATAWEWVTPDSRQLLTRGGLEFRHALCHTFGDLSADMNSATGRPIRNPNQDSAVIPYGNGIVHDLMRAFQHSLQISFRPDDIWLAITTQFSYFVNGTAEEGPKRLVTNDVTGVDRVDNNPMRLPDVDGEYMMQALDEAFQAKVIDGEFKDWLLPGFTTTTDTDRAVAAIVMMPFKKSYFKGDLEGGCGFPSIALEGERSDWIEIRWRLEKLLTFSNHKLTSWYSLLVPILDHMVSSFDQPNDLVIKNFWLCAVHGAGRLEGCAKWHLISGWLTAFCYFNLEGQVTKSLPDGLLKTSPQYEAAGKRLILNGTVYPVIRPSNVPPSVVTVSMMFIDEEQKFLYQTTLAAGCVGMGTSLDKGKGIDRGEDRVWPRSGWWVLEDKCNVLANPKGAKQLASTEKEKPKVTKKVELVNQEEALQLGKGHVHWVCEGCMRSVGYCASCQSRMSRKKQQEEEEAQKKKAEEGEKDKEESAKATAAASTGDSASDK